MGKTLFVPSMISGSVIAHHPESGAQNGTTN